MSVETGLPLVMLLDGIPYTCHMSFTRETDLNGHRGGLRPSRSPHSKYRIFMKMAVPSLRKFYRSQITETLLITILVVVVHMDYDKFVRQFCCHGQAKLTIPLYVILYLQKDQTFMGTTTPG